MVLLQQFFISKYGSVLRGKRNETVFFFNYKSRKAKYRLAEQALSSGQQLPEDFFKNAEKTEDIRTKGIKNIFIGIGLFIFLWAITDEFSIGCIGLLVMFTGIGRSGIKLMRSA